jgi:hypothetical protein
MGRSFGGRSGKGYSSGFAGRRAYITTSFSKGDSKTKKTAMSAVPEQDLKSRSWLRGYPSEAGVGVHDFGAGKMVFDPANLSKHLDANKSEWKRRMEYATSFTASSIRTMRTVAAGVADSFPDKPPKSQDMRGYLAAVLKIHEKLTTPAGREFIQACNMLDMSVDMDRPLPDLRLALKTFFKFLKKADDLQAAFVRMTNDSSRVYLGAVWSLECRACLHDVERWAEGFPTQQDQLALMDPSVKKWLRDPQDVSLLMDAIIQGYFNRLKPKNTSKKTNWDHIGDSGDSDGVEQESEDEEEMQPPARQRGASRIKRSDEFDSEEEVESRKNPRANKKLDAGGKNKLRKRKHPFRLTMTLMHLKRAAKRSNRSTATTKHHHRNAAQRSSRSIATTKHHRRKRKTKHVRASIVTRRPHRQRRVGDPNARSTATMTHQSGVKAACAQQNTKNH